MTIPSVDPPTTVCQALFPDPIPDIIAHGSLTYMAGASGTGKTIVLADWSARLRDGREILGHKTNPPSEICVLAADRDWSTYDKAFRHAGIPEVRRYVLAEDHDFDPRAWKRTETFKFLERCLNKLSPKPGAFVIIDPIAPLFVQGKTNDNWDVAISSHYYRQETRQRQITMVCTANVSKQRTEDYYIRPQDRIAGSGAFVAYSDTQIYLERDKEGILTLGWVPRTFNPQEFQMRFDPISKLFVVVEEIPGGAADLPSHLAEVYKLIPYPPLTITSPELAKLVIEKRKVKRAMAFRCIQQLIERGTIERNELGVIRRIIKADDPAKSHP